jgi:hypothetical protein
MDTDEHGFLKTDKWVIGWLDYGKFARRTRRQSINPFIHPSDFIRVHLCPSVVKIKWT